MKKASIPILPGKSLLTGFLLFFLCSGLSAHTVSTINAVTTISTHATGRSAFGNVQIDSIITPPPSLGTAANFVLFTVSGAVGNTGVSQITGNLGTNNGAITGFGTSAVTGTIYNADTVTVQCSTDLMAAYTQLNNITPTSTAHAPAFGSGETLFAGVYSIGGAGSVAGNLTLDGQGNSNAVFIFKIGGAFTTGASTIINLVNEASACNVFWIAEGAIAMAASTTMRGTLIAHNAAISMAAGGTLEGRMFSTTGAVAVDGVSASLPVCYSSWTGATSTDWYTVGNWFYNIIPITTTNIKIPGSLTNYPILNSGTGSVQNIIIKSGGSLTVTGSALQISGSISIIDSMAIIANAGTIVMNGSEAQTIPAATFSGNAVNNLTVNNNVGVTLGGPLNLSGILLVDSGQFNTGGYLTLISTGTQTALIDGSGIGGVLGNVTMQRYLTAGYGYKYFSSPFTAATVSNFSGTVDLTATFANFYSYVENQATSGFTKYITTTDTLNPMQGYAADFGSAKAAKTVSIIGIVNNGAISSTLYNHNQTYTQGFNLVGNPYPSPIDWNSSSGWTKTNIDNAIYYFDSDTSSQYTGAYSTYINGVSSDGIAGNIIASMQGFFVHVSNGNYPVTGTFAVNNNVRVNNLNPVFHKSTFGLSAAPRVLLRLSAGFSELSSDPLVVYFDNKATPAFDNGLDAVKLMNTNEQTPNLYSLGVDASKLVINALHKLDTLTIIPLGLQTSKDGVVTFALRDLEQWPNDLHLYLSDAETGINQDMQQNPKFSVSLKQGTYESRFSLRCIPLNAKVNTNSKDDIYTVYGSGGNLFIHIKLINNQKGDLIISNMQGKLISRKAINGNGDYELDGRMVDAIYVVSFVTATGIHSEKVFLSSR